MFGSLAVLENNLQQIARVKVELNSFFQQSREAEKNTYQFWDFKSQKQPMGCCSELH